MMTQEEKELVLIDIYARLPHMPRVRIIYQQQGIEGVDEGEMSMDYNEQIINDLRNGIILDIKPYLRPLSSMTEDEYEELKKMTITSPNLEAAAVLYKERHYDEEPNWRNVWSHSLSKVLDWLNKKMFDFRANNEGKTLIDAGLALMAPKDMYRKER